MKFYVFKPLLAFGLLSLTSAMQNAQASVVATATVNWNNINVEIIDLSGGQNTPQFTWISQQGDINTSSQSDLADYVYDTQSAADFSTKLNSTSTSAHAGSHALRSSTILQVQAQSDFLGSNNANTSAANQGSFEMRGKGIAVISLGWNLEVSGADNVNNIYSSGTASVFLSGNFMDGNGANGGGSKTVVLTPAGSESNSGIYRFTVTGDGVSLVSGNFSAMTQADTSVVSSVPLPSAFWLFGSALIASAGRFQRKSPSA